MVYVAFLPTTPTNVVENVFAPAASASVCTAVASKYVLHNTNALLQYNYIRIPNPISSSVYFPHGCAFLWLRVGYLRLCDNAAVAAAVGTFSLLPIATVSRSELIPRVTDALTALQDALQRIGSVLVIRVVDNRPASHVDAICKIANIVRPNRLIYNADSFTETISFHPFKSRAIALSPFRVSRPGFSNSNSSSSNAVSCLFSSPPSLPPPPSVSSLTSDSIPLSSAIGENDARQKLSSILSSSIVSLNALRWKLQDELYVGTICDARIRVELMQFLKSHQRVSQSSDTRGRGSSFKFRPLHMIAAAMNSPAVAAMGVAAYDVNGGDRRGVEWDHQSKSFILKEWEHTETERLMPPRQRFGEFLRRKRQFFIRAFFPDDVTPDYYSFTIWRFAQRCVSATIGVFGTSSLLYALGIRSGRIGQAAAISWVLKDGLGRVGKMVWAGSMSKDFDVDPKRWRFRSALLYAAGNGLEIVTRIFPSSFLLFATVGNSMKQVSMMTASACRNAMYRSFGEQSQNIANITAKGEAQIVVADLIGMATGIQLSKMITSRGRILGVYLLMTLMDVLGIYMELRQVVFRSINPERSSIIINQLLKNGILLRPTQVSPKESIFLRPSHKKWVRMTSIAKAATDPEELSMLLRVFKKERFLIATPRIRCGGPCRLVLRRDASNEDVLRAMLMVGYVHNEMNVLGKDVIESQDAERILRNARTLTKRAFPRFVSALQENGWNTRNLLFSTLKRRGYWTP